MLNIIFYSWYVSISPIAIFSSINTFGIQLYIIFSYLFSAPLVVTALVAAPIIFSPSGIQIIAPVSTGTGTTFDPFATFPQIQVNLLRGIVN